MKKIIFVFYVIVFASASISLDKLQDLMANKEYKVEGIFYKYDFANIQSAWDFVYVSNDVYYQIKGVDSTSNNVFGWKIIDKITVSDPNFYFVYLSDVNESGNTKYNWVALSKTNSTINKLIGSTSSGYFSWSNNLSKLSFSFTQDNKKIRFHRAINGGGAIGDKELPKFPDFFKEVNSTTGGVNTSNTDNVDTGNNTGNNTGNTTDNNTSDANTSDANNSNNGNNQDNNSSGNASNDSNSCTQFSGNDNSSCLKYYEEAKKFPKTPECGVNIKCMQYYIDQELESCKSFVTTESDPPTTGECIRWKP